MDSEHCEIRWQGPFRWYGTDDYVLFRRPEAEAAGIYLWATPFEKGYLVYYVGETGRSFTKRFTEHPRDCLSGLYRIYDPAKFSKGIKELIWEGMWKPGTRDRMGEFHNLYSDLAPCIYEFMGLFRIFIAPLDTEKRMRERVEAGIANRLNEQQGLVREFQDQDIRYLPRRTDEEPIQVTMSIPKLILGLSDPLMA